MSSDKPRHHAVNQNGARVHSTDDFDACVLWAFDYLSEPFTILTTRNGEPVIERSSSVLVDFRDAKRQPAK